MHKDHRNQLYKAAIVKWGKPSQLEMMIEEASELILALQKFKRNPSAEHAAEVSDELADVEVMLEQLDLIFEPDDKERQKQIKLERLEARLATEMYAKYQMDSDKLESIVGKQE